MKWFILLLLLTGCLRPSIKELQRVDKEKQAADEVVAKWVHDKSEACLSQAKKSPEKVKAYITCSESVFSTAQDISFLLSYLKAAEKEEADVILGVIKGTKTQKDLDEARKKLVAGSDQLQKAVKELK